MVLFTTLIFQLAKLTYTVVSNISLIENPTIYFIKKKFTHIDKKFAYIPKYLRNFPRLHKKESVPSFMGLEQ